MIIIIGILTTIIGILILKQIISVIFTYINREEPARNYYPVITFDQFSSFYPTARDKWRWKPDEYIVLYTRKNPHNLFGYTEEGFTWKIGEDGKFRKFFEEKERENREEKNTKVLLNCLDSWREDANAAEACAKLELERAAAEYERITGNKVN